MVVLLYCYYFSCRRVCVGGGGRGGGNGDGSGTRGNNGIGGGKNNSDGRVFVVDDANVVLCLNTTIYIKLLCL